MKVLRAQDRVSKPLPALLLAFAAACATHSGAPPDRASAATTPAEPELRVGEPVERQLAPGETHAYRVEVPAGSYLRIVAEPKAMDLALTLLAPDGTVLAAADGPGGSKERELLSLIAATGGSCRLEVKRKDEGESRGYSLQLEERRPMLSSDEIRIRAEQAFAEALHLQFLGAADATKRAFSKFEESLALREELGDSVGQVESLNHTGLTLYAQGEVTEAIARYERAAELSQAIGYRQGEGEALNNLGLAYSRLAEPDKTLDYYQRALAIWRAIDNPGQAANTLHNLGVFLYDRGEPRRAYESLEEALPLWRESGDLAGEANSLNSLGALQLFFFGEPKAALDSLSRALSLSRAAGSPVTEAYVTSSLALAHRTRGELQQALDLYRAVIARWESVGDPTSLGNVREALAGLYAELGELERAAEEYRRILKLYHSAGNRDYEARVLNALGLVESLSNRPLAALDLYRQSLALSREIGNRRSEAIALRRSGIAERALGNLDAALANLEQCLELTRATGNRAEEASTLLDLGLVQHRLGREGSFQNLERALELARHAENATLQASTLFQWAKLDRDAERFDQARARLEEALGIIESVRQQVASRDLRATFLAARREYYEDYIDVLMRLDASRPGEGFAEKAFEASERARARSLLELLAEGRIDVRGGIAPELREREKQLASRISLVQMRLLNLLSREGPASGEVAQRREELGTALQEREDLEAEIRSQHPRYAEVRYPFPLTLSEVKATLDEDTVLLEYALGQSASYLFVVTREGFRAHRLPPAQEIGKEVEQLRRTTASPERRLLGQFALSSHRLYHLLLLPAASVLEHHATIIIVADGNLHLLPFETLAPAPALEREDISRLSFLLRTHTVSYIPSASVLPRLHLDKAKGDDGKPTTSSLVAFADPLGQANARLEVAAASLLGLASSLPGLPESRREVQGIAKLFALPDVSLFIGADATEDNAKLEGVLSRARRVHFATHAFLSEVRPELSGLVLARSPSSAEDGLLQVYEIFNLDLDAELVVLSSCQSGLGKRIEGEGLVGLARAFLYAGTSSLVASLWAVNDASTADLMIEFYRRLNQENDRAEALRAAKLYVLADPERAHPFHWAPFVLIGETGRSVTRPQPLRLSCRDAKGGMVCLN